MIEPLAERMSSVEDFLHDIDPSLQYHIVPISDPFGPTKEDPTLEVSGIFIDCDHTH
jgi:phosphopantetheine adenylyltransferase/dephospho-CoA kinase